MSWDLMDDFFPDGGDDRSQTEFDGVECVHETPAAIICMIDGKRRSIPKSQVSKTSEVQSKGDKGILQVTKWFAKKMEDEEAQPEQGPVTIEGVVVMREARSGKAIEVRLPSGKEEWIPVTQLVEGQNECRYDGDMGKLVITAWIAKEKGLAGG